MTKTVFSTIILFFSLTAFAASNGKTIYVPEHLRSMDLQSDTSQWSLKRSLETDDLIFMWERRLLAVRRRCRSGQANVVQSSEPSPPRTVVLSFLSLSLWGS